MTTNQAKLYTTCKSFLGSPIAVNARLGCAETVNTLHKYAFGKEIGGGASTLLLWEALKADDSFVSIPEYEIGAIIISPTGTQPALSRLAHGHVGVCGYFQIMSNNSLTGLLDTQFTYGRWRSLFKDYGGFPIYFFRKV